MMESSVQKGQRLRREGVGMGVIVGIAALERLGLQVGDSGGRSGVADCAAKLADQVLAGMARPPSSVTGIPETY